MEFNQEKFLRHYELIEVTTLLLTRMYSSEEFKITQKDFNQIAENFEQNSAPIYDELNDLNLVDIEGKKGETFYFLTHHAIWLFEYNKVINHSVLEDYIQTYHGAVCQLDEDHHLLLYPENIKSSNSEVNEFRKDDYSNRLLNKLPKYLMAATPIVFGIFTIYILVTQDTSKIKQAPPKEMIELLDKINLDSIVRRDMDSIQKTIDSLKANQ